MPFEDCTNPDERPIGYYQVMLDGSPVGTIALWGGKRWWTCETQAHSSRVVFVGPRVKMDQDAEYELNPAWLERHGKKPDAP